MKNVWITPCYFVPDVDEFKYLISPRFGKIIKPIKLGPKCTWNSRIIYEMSSGKKILEGVKHFYDYFGDYCWKIHCYRERISLKGEYQLKLVCIIILPKFCELLFNKKYNKNTLFSNKIIILNSKARFSFLKSLCRYWELVLMITRVPSTHIMLSSKNHKLRNKL